VRRALYALVLAFAAVGAWTTVQAVRRAREAKSPQSLYLAGASALYRGRFRGAVALLTDVLRAEPRNARAYYFRGLALRELRSLPSAVDDLTKALSLDPTLAGAYYERALAREDLGDVLSALSDVEFLLAAHPDRVELRSMRARLLRGIGRNYEAEEELDKALQSRPGSYFTLVDRAALRRARSDTAGSVADCAAAIALDPGLAPAYIGRAETLSDAGRSRFEEAIADQTKAIALLGQLANLRFSPHVWGSAVGLATAAHLVASLTPAPHTDNVPWPTLVEHDVGPNPLRTELLEKGLTLIDGELVVPEGPGLGVSLDEAAVKRYRVL